MAFKRGNQRQSVFSSRSIIYLPGVLHGKVGGADFDVPVPKQFRPITSFLTAVPGGMNDDLAVYVSLKPPATGSYAAGNHPLLHITLTGVGIVQGDGDLLVVGV